MTIPLWCLVLVAGLPQAWAVVADYHRKRQFGSIDNDLPRAQYAKLEGAGARARGAEKNAWEALPVFAVCVLVAHMADANPSRSAVAALSFVVFRVAHGLAYIAGLSTLRSTVFLLGMACCVWLVVLAAGA